MTTERKATFKNEVVTIIREEYKSSFGDLLRIRLETGEEKVVLSTKLQKI